MIDPSLLLAIQHIESKLKEGSNASAKVKSEADALVKELRDVETLLRGADARTGLSTSHDIRQLLVELRGIAYNAEDEVDTAMVEYSALPNYLGFGDSRALTKLQTLREHAKEVKLKLDRHFNESNRSKKGTLLPVCGAQSPKGHLPPNGDLVVGIDHDIKMVVDLLTKKPNDGNEPVDKLAIVGMGGSGKTTLARSIYNHKVVKKHFQFRVWVSGSQVMNPYLLLPEILKQIRAQKSWVFRFFQPHNDKEPEEDSYRLVLRINDLLYQKNCLLVLDDVWDMLYLHKFITLIQGEDYNSPRYTMIITSRQTLSSDHIKWYNHQQQPLANEKCWELFSKAASQNPSKPLTDDKRSWAKEMLARCQGLPLAIVALAWQLRTKHDPREWQRVCFRVTGTDGATIYDPVNEILGFSYDQLPYYLKPCFLYLGLFPEGSDISAGTLTRMWIAEGFIETTNEESIEVAATRYLQELIDHTMVQVVRRTYTGKVKTITIHDLMRDFCILRARDLDFLGVSDSVLESIGRTSRRGAINLSKTLILPADSANLRTLSLFGKSSSREARERYNSQVNHRYLNLVDVCQMYKLLRIMDIFGINSMDGNLPKEIGDLYHLTYLRIRSTNIRKLPKSIGKLSNLLTLDYWDVLTDSEIIVPNVLWKLKRLRYLYLPNEMSSPIEDLKLHDTLENLRTLWGVGGGDWMIKEMRRLSSTLSKLYIHRISDKHQMKAILDCTEIMENKNLNVLALDWYSFEIKSFDSLASKESLKKLRLIGKAPDKSYSDGHQFPSNLGKLELYYTQLENHITMTHLGNLVSLKVLRLSKDSYIGSEWTCDCNAFPVLEELKLTNLQKLEDWIIEEGAFPCLKKLSIISCTKLKRIPKGLMYVRSLEKLDIERMPWSFIFKIQKVKERNDDTTEGEDYPIIQHIPKTTIHDSWAVVSPVF